jgi:hypothetical protein
MADRLFYVKTTLDAIEFKLLQIEILTCDRWLSTQQALGIIESLPNAIYARAKAACILFSRLVDIEHFIQVLY